jgi:hypothetical protein
LWTNNSLPESYWSKENVDNKIEIMEELKEAKKKKKVENHLVK